MKVEQYISYAGPEESGGYRLTDNADYTPERLIDNFLPIFTPDQLETYNYVLAGGNYTDEQKSRILLSMALENEVANLLEKDESKRRDALIALMDKCWENFEYDKVSIITKTKWSDTGGNSKDRIGNALVKHYKKLEASYPRVGPHRKYDALFNAYGIPAWLKSAATFAINRGGNNLDRIAKMLLRAFMLGDSIINKYDADANKMNNQKYNIKGFIDDQSDLKADASKIKMGLHTADYNGCGWIATYNILHMLEKDMQPWEIVEIYDKTGGALVDGEFGINPEAISLLLKSQGIKTKMDYFPNNIDAQIKNSGVAVFNYLHNSGAHYVAMKFSDGKFAVYNDSSANKKMAESSVDAWMHDRKWLPLSLVTLR